jgi:hypothetical protein
LNGISRLDVKSTSLSDVELENVLDTNVSVFTTELLLDLTIHRRTDSFIPLVHVNNCAVLKNLSGFGRRISNSDGHTSLLILRLELESHLLGGRSTESEVVDTALRSVNDSWESRLSYLTGVETIPNVIHEGVELGVHAGVGGVLLGVRYNLLDIDGLH